MDRQRVNQALTELHQFGVAMLYPISPMDTVFLRDWLEQREVFADCHVPQIKQFNRKPVLRSEAARSECVCIDMGYVIRAPFLLERGLEIRELAEEYFGQPPLAYSMNAFWTRPGPAGTRPDIQEFHRDLDDVQFLAMFVYLTDVLLNADGPHELKGPDGVVRPIYGPAGTVFLANTSHEHRGIKPRTKERGIAWMRWGVSDPPASYVWDGNEPIDSSWLRNRYPTDPKVRESIKLLVKATDAGAL